MRKSTPSRKGSFRSPTLVASCSLGQARGVSSARGYLTLGRYRGAPVRLHWSVVLGMLFVSGLRWAPGAWAGYLVVILLHELGHAVLARRYGLSVREIVVHGMGGHCAYAGYPSLYQQAIIATGGVLAQLLLLVVAIPIAALVPLGPDLADLMRVLTYSNGILILVNLIPLPPLDGHLILQLPGLHARAVKERLAAEARRASVAPRARGAAEPVDEQAVKELVRRALEDAKRAAKERPN